MPGYFAFKIYNYITNCLEFINIYLNTIRQNYNYKRIVTIYKSFIKEEYLGIKELKVIRVSVLP